MPDLPAFDTILSSYIASLEAEVANAIPTQGIRLSKIIDIAWAKIAMGQGLGSSGSSGNTTVSVQRVPMLILATNSGTIAAGAVSVAVANSGSAAGSVLGVSLSPGVGLSWDSPSGDTLGPIAYDATGTVFMITEVR